jgi:ribA/ribD-fused uncharacterized protein
MAHRRTNQNSVQSNLPISKLFFQILQCLHHISNVTQSNGLKNKAFQKKRDELDRFIRPAQESSGSKFRQQYKIHINNFLLQTLSELESHYQERIESLLSQTRSANLSGQDFKTAVMVALKWGRKNFGSKLSSNTINKFHSLINPVSNTSPTRATSTAPHHPNTHQSFPTNRSEETLSPTPGPSRESQPHYLDRQSTVHYPHLSPPNKQTNFHPPQAEVTLPEARVVTEPSTPTRQTPPHTKSSSFQFTSRTPPVRGMPESDRSSTNSPRRGTPPTPTSNNQSHQFSDPAPTHQGSRNIRGSNDPLSNFYHCTLRYEGMSFVSAEHAYQYQKALLLAADEGFLIKLAGVQSSHLAQKLGKQLNNPKNGDKIRQWEQIRGQVMESILTAKAKQVDLFRSTLIATGNQTLTHNLFNRFWGTTHVTATGSTFIGQNVFAILLTELRSNLQNQNKPRPTHPTKPNQNRNMLNQPNNRFITLQTDPLPHQDSAENTEPAGHAVRRSARIASKRPNVITPHPNQLCSLPANPTQQRSKPKGYQQKQTNVAVSGPQIHKSYIKDQPNTWENLWAHCQSEAIIIGDSNLKRVTSVPKHSVEIHSFSGARAHHLTKVLQSCNSKFSTPQNIILSVGINSRGGEILQCAKLDYKDMIEQASEIFPNATIHVPLINISGLLRRDEQEQLNQLNEFIEKVCPDYSKHFKILPTIEPNKFQTDPSGVHWTQAVANRIMRHWLNHLN